MRKLRSETHETKWKCIQETHTARCDASVLVCLNQNHVHEVTRWDDAHDRRGRDGSANQNILGGTKTSKIWNLQEPGQNCSPDVCEERTWDTSSRTSNFFTFLSHLRRNPRGSGCKHFRTFCGLALMIPSPLYLRTHEAELEHQSEGRRFRSQHQ